uniref:AMOP domain-containing protein n=1 Tax=Steinernema glaseri TaxID=37863 RepID=A0A1I8ABC4_9BILA
MVRKQSDLRIPSYLRAISRPMVTDATSQAFTARKMRIPSTSTHVGPIFCPTSLIINNECGENRRIRAFKWFCDYFSVPSGADRLLSCKNMPIKIDRMQYPLSYLYPLYQPDWSSIWREVPCDCVPAHYGGLIPYFDPENYPERWVEMNEHNRKLCVRSIYENPGMYYMDKKSSACIKHPSADF